MGDFANLLNGLPSPFWTLMGATLGAGISAGVTVFVVHSYNKSTKSVEATLALSNRFQELFAERHRLNKIYRTQDNWTKKRDKLDEADARDWYRQYFDLLLNEYRFYKRGLIDRKDFVQWMRWERKAFNNETHTVCGMTCAEGWQWWSSADSRKEVMSHEPVVKLLERIHCLECPDPEALIDKIYY